MNRKKDCPSPTDVSRLKKGYWLVASKSLKLSYLYTTADQGHKRIILDELVNYHIYVQSDGYSAYKRWRQMSIRTYGV